MLQRGSEKGKADYTRGDLTSGKHIAEGPQFPHLVKGLDQIDVSTDAVTLTVV